MKKITLECKRHNVHFTVNNLPNFREQQKTAHAAGIWYLDWGHDINT